MLVGIADLSFLASHDFRLIIDTVQDISFGIYSPLEWALSRQRYGIFGYKRPEIQYSIDDYLKSRLERVGNYELLRDNLKRAHRIGAIMPIRSRIFYPYRRKFWFVDPSSMGSELIYRDLSNIILAGKLNLPLWVEKDSVNWMKENLGFVVNVKSDEITIPLTVGNPRNTVNEIISIILGERAKGRPIASIIETMTPHIRELYRAARVLKVVIFGSSELIPLADMIPKFYRLIGTGILTILDVKTIFQEYSS